MIRKLRGRFSERESISMADYLLFAVAGTGTTQRVLDPDRLIDENLKSILNGMLDELMNSKPVQYVAGKAYFHGIELSVNESVLVPRPETEELVAWIAGEHQGVKGLKVLDIGTGSGCIILALGTLLDEPVLNAVDVSPSALKTASGNGDRLGIRVKFKVADILDYDCWSDFQRFDVIVSNPPYVRESEKKLMQPNVLDYEPAVALFVPDNDPMRFYRAIAAFAWDHLEPGGKVYVEINENLGTETMAVFREAGFTGLILKQDIRGKDRMIRACF